MHLSGPTRRAVGCVVIGAIAALAWDVFVGVHLDPDAWFSLGWAYVLLASTAVVVGVAVWLRVPIVRWPLLLVVPIVLLAVDVALYANTVSDILAGLGGFALIGVLACSLLRTPVAWTDAGWIIGGDVVATGLRSFRGLAVVVRTLIAPDGHRHWWREVCIGAVLAIPFLLLFTVLFASSDPAVASWIARLVDLATIEVLWRVVRRVILAMAVIGFVGSALLLPPPFSEWDAKSRAVRSVIAATFFTLLNLLFAAFLVYEVLDLIRSSSATSTTTLAGAARRSFGELVVAAAFAWALGVAWYRVFTLEVTDRAQHVASRCLAGFLWLTVGLAALTVVQMLRYTDAYGLTRARVYALVTVVALAIAVGYLAVAGWRRWSATRIGRALSVGAIVAFTLVMSAPVERFVGEWNVQRQLRGEAKVPLDLEYLQYGLSADAGPAFARYARSDRTARAQLLGERCAAGNDRTPLYDVRRVVYVSRDWRGWNFFERQWCRELPKVQDALRAIDAAPPATP